MSNRNLSEGPQANLWLPVSDSVRFIVYNWRYQTQICPLGSIQFIFNNQAVTLICRFMTQKLWLVVWFWNPAASWSNFLTVRGSGPGAIRLLSDRQEQTRLLINRNRKFTNRWRSQTFHFISPAAVPTDVSTCGFYRSELMICSSNHITRLLFGIVGVIKFANWMFYSRRKT